jgi:hypothetical protein
MKKVYLAVLVAVFMTATAARAQSTRLAAEDDIRLLKNDVLTGGIKIDETRLKTITGTYGKPSNVTETDTRLTYDYGELRIVFDKKKYLRRWEYDYSRTAVYSREAEQLRFDLESRQIAGDFVTFESIRKSYGEPTARVVMDGDGDQSVYYYGIIKLVFENVVVVQSWRGSGLDIAGSFGPVAESGVLKTGTESNTVDAAK